MHFSGSGKCIWALPQPRPRFRLLVCLQRQRKAFKTSLTEFMYTFAFSNSEAFLCFLERWQLFHAFCKEQRAECIFQAWKNAFGHGSACSGLVLELGIRLKSY